MEEKVPFLFEHHVVTKLTLLVPNNFFLFSAQC